MIDLLHNVLKSMNFEIWINLWRQKKTDVYLLYEYMNKLFYTVRIKVILKVVDEVFLKEAAQKAFRRFPYFSVLC